MKRGERGRLEREWERSWDRGWKMIGKGRLKSYCGKVVGQED